MLLVWTNLVSVKISIIELTPINDVSFPPISLIPHSIKQKNNYKNVFWSELPHEVHM